jgi:hypothetical protein
MATPAVGEDIEALCGKCGDVWHVVMAKMGERIAKVVCKRCGGHHLYRTSEGAPNVNDSISKTTKGRVTRSRVAETPAAAPVPAFDPSKPPRPYAPSEGYLTGDRVSHLKFGVGVVTGSPGPGKVEIAFTSGRRVLASARVASTLERPTMAAHVPIGDRPPGKL